MNQNTDGMRSLDQLVADACGGVFLVDQHGVYVFFNDVCERITGYSAADIVGSMCRCGDLTECRDRHGRSLSGVLCPTRMIFDGQRDSMRQKMTLTRKDSRTIWVETIYTAIKNYVGRPEFVIGLVRELTAAEAAAEASGQVWPPAEANQFDRADPTMVAGIEPAESSTELPDRASEDLLLLDRRMEQFERQVILRALASAGGQRNRAAELMGISRSRLYRRMEALGIKPDELP